MTTSFKLDPKKSDLLFCDKSREMWPSDTPKVSEEFSQLVTFIETVASYEDIYLLLNFYPEETLKRYRASLNASLKANMMEAGFMWLKEMRLISDWEYSRGIQAHAKLDALRADLVQHIDAIIADTNDEPFDISSDVLEEAMRGPFTKSCKASENLLAEIECDLQEESQ